MRAYFILFIITYALTSAWPASFLYASAPTGSIEVIMTGFDSDDGNVRIHLYNKASGKYFPDVSDKAFKLIVSKIKGRKAVVEFPNLPYGDYAITVHHDANKNVKMDKNFLGYPAEGWGLSGNVMPILSLPDFDECKIKLNAETLKTTILIRN